MPKPAAAPPKVLIIEDDNMAQTMYARRFADDTRVIMHLATDARLAQGWLIEHPDTAVIVVSTSAHKQPRGPDSLMGLIIDYQKSPHQKHFILTNFMGDIQEAFMAVSVPALTRVIPDGRKERVYDEVLSLLDLPKLHGDAS